MLYKTWTIWNETSSQWKNTVTPVSTSHSKHSDYSATTDKLLEKLTLNSDFYWPLPHLWLLVSKSIWRQKVKQVTSFCLPTQLLCGQNTEQHLSKILSSVSVLLQLDIWYKNITPGQRRGWKCLLPSLLPLILVSGYKGQDSPNTIQSIL